MRTSQNASMDCITWNHRGYLPGDSGDLQGHTLSNILVRLCGSCTIRPKVNLEQDWSIGGTFHLPSICRPLALCRYPCQLDRQRYAYSWSIDDEPTILGWDICCLSQVWP